ncbi:uncharacterized protein [Dysidea avara]|uniref:uncharacterized protein n=1 Tax=Dysidea avara TaxID=196820 RepID=UPI003318E346
MKILPDDDIAAKKVMGQSNRGYYVVDGILYHGDAMMPSRKRIVVPTRLRDQVLSESHDVSFAGQFAAKKMYEKGLGRRHNLSLKSIPVGKPFDCIGMDFKEMDISSKAPAPVTNRQKVIIVHEWLDDLFQRTVSTEHKHRAFWVDPSNGREKRQRGIYHSLSQEMRQFFTNCLRTECAGWSEAVGHSLGSYSILVRSSLEDAGKHFLHLKPVTVGPFFGCPN